jgi:hypothetical protein
MVASPVWMSSRSRIPVPAYISGLPASMKIAVRWPDEVISLSNQAVAF